MSVVKACSAKSESLLLYLWKNITFVNYSLYVEKLDGMPELCLTRLCAKLCQYNVKKNLFRCKSFIYIRDCIVRNATQRAHNEGHIIKPSFSI